MGDSRLCGPLNMKSRIIWNVTVFCFGSFVPTNVSEIAAVIILRTGHVPDGQGFDFR
jgi:hypothetical protein